MKKYFYILLIVMLPASSVLAQNKVKIAERMTLYIQKNLGLSKAEARSFRPIFFHYLRDIAQTHRQFKTDRLVLQQKIIELRLDYRKQFSTIINAVRANQVFQYEDRFRKEVIRIIQENRRNDGIPMRKNQFREIP
ncbi:MAG: hypothetical protein R2796_00770 [Chitinophagaceae bacterium]|nr:hypothetical protein [Chitinophagaceae bacterium]MCB0741734.1 hypothetical protein [Chitinophagaceae bacterium]HQU57341.1 hypothetical protein [Chitinophagaceae bacterium]HQV05797.1 hypothetical protein [Chitinophagaceae bacterium]